jgi:serine protease AprX
MNRILKVFVTGDEQEKLPGVTRIIERYDGFVVVEAPQAVADALKQQYLEEDITAQYNIEVGQRQINTAIPRVDKSGKQVSHPAYEDERDLPRGPHHFLVQFIGPIKAEWLSGVEQVGGALRAPHGDFTYVVRANKESLQRIAKLPFVRWVGHLPYRDRIAPTALDFAGRGADDLGSVLPRTQVLPGTYTVEFFSGGDVPSGEAKAKSLGFTIVGRDEDARVLVVDTDHTSKQRVREQLEALSEVHGVRSIRERPVKRPSNDAAAVVMNTAAALGNTGLSLSGNGEVIGICDTGLDSGNPAAIHRDFTNRVSFIKSYPMTSIFDKEVKNPRANDGPADVDSGHGTHVAGSVLGSGAASAGLAGLVGPIRGLAHQAQLVFQAVEQEMQWKNPQFNIRPGRFILAGIPLDLTDLFSDAFNQGARIHSNSWGGGDPGAYDEQCEQLDRFVWNHRDFCIVVAAGNDGTDRDGDGVINAMSVTSPGTAKNCITVGACENNRPNFALTYGEGWPDDYPVPPFDNDKVADNPDQVVAFSSRGPTQDGRVKPDVVAPGTFILSTRSRLIAGNHFGWRRFGQSTLYMYDGGTSMATPLTAGAVALLREYLRTRQAIAVPSAALLKAALILGATRLPVIGVHGAVLDNDQGFGRVNIDLVVAPPAPARATFVEVQPGLTTGQFHSVNVTVNSGNVPLRVVLAYSDFPGATLVNNLNLIVRGPNGFVRAGNQTSGASPSLDTQNNVEVVHLDTPGPGVFTIQVVAANVPQGPQPFALAYAGGF